MKHHGCSIVTPPGCSKKGVLGPKGRQVDLFVDADNQSCLAGWAVCSFLQAHGHQIRRAVIAGNAIGRKQNHGWRGWLKDFDVPEVETFSVPVRKDSADVRLILALGTYMEHPPGPDTLVLVLSRDNVLVETARVLSDSGVAVMVACNRQPSLPQNTQVPVLAVDLGQCRKRLKLAKAA
ncbi:NYN domain-containing protein [Thioalkalivibrio sp. ALE16]|uniref:NYN domain-containing protein n=1 Tax=Thioalkalivibrio sp. ALE16 TaxID=1158172 RepID=UPI0009DB775D|nr:NYN domain-containing protein [Thioalkalivibrio sp. ALE16]